MLKDNDMTTIEMVLLSRALKCQGLAFILGLMSILLRRVIVVCEREIPTTSPRAISNYTKLFGGWVII